MKQKTKQRLTIVMLIMLGSAVAVTLVILALNKNINLFFTPSDVADGKAPATHSFRLGGMVSENSVKRSKDGGLTISFIINDGTKSVLVDYTGILPDLFREGQGIVATGKLSADGKIFKASEILAKHDENYMPPEAKYAMDAAKLKKMKNLAANGNISRLKDEK